MRLTLLTALVAALATPFALGSGNEGLPKSWCEEPNDLRHHHYLGPATGLFIILGQDGNIEDCDRDGVPYDYDGHVEWAVGGAWLSVDTGDGVSFGSLACWGESGHHPDLGPVAVVDVVFGSAIPFEVGADRVNEGASTFPECGDFEVDHAVRCVGSCAVPFSAGLDGTYVVFVGDADSGAVGVEGWVDS